MPALLLAMLFAAGPEWAIYGACLGLAAAVFLFIFYIQPDASDLAPHRTKLDQLLERRDTIYDNLRDLKFEYRAGKYSDGDYETMKVTLENEAALVLAQIEQVTESQIRRPRPAARPAGPDPASAAGRSAR
jgi:cell division protein FtsW (lipid II flippase)